MADRVSHQGRYRIQVVSGSRLRAISWWELPPKAVAPSPRNDVEMRVRHFLPGTRAIRQGKRNPFAALDRRFEMCGDEPAGLCKLRNLVAG
jgi:hypothetical protein